MNLCCTAADSWVTMAPRPLHFSCFRPALVQFPDLYVQSILFTCHSLVSTKKTNLYPTPTWLKHWLILLTAISAYPPDKGRIQARYKEPKLQFQGHPCTWRLFLYRKLNFPIGAASIEKFASHMNQLKWLRSFFLANYASKKSHDGPGGPPKLKRGPSLLQPRVQRFCPKSVRGPFFEQDVVKEAANVFCACGTPSR